jgi:hypothetical protein
MPRPDAGSDGGTSDGGTSDGGTSDGGTTDGGTSDGGTTDGGRSDGGTSDGGRTDGGTIDAGPPDSGAAFTGDPDQVQLLGTLTESPDPLTPAIASFGSPTTATIGLPTTALLPLSQVRQDGRLVYLDFAGSKLRMVRLDPYERMGSGSRYPSNPSGNDDVLPTPACDGGQPLSAFWLHPDSVGYVYRCGSVLEYFEGPTTGVPAFSGASLVSLGVGGTALISKGASMDFTIDGAGVQHPVFGLLNVTLADRAQRERTREVRANATGWWVTFGQPGSGLEPCDLYEIVPNGTATKLGWFAGLPTGTTAADSCTGRISAAGTLYTVGQQAGGFDAVAQRPQFPGNSSVVYTENGANPSSFTTYPPIVFTFLDSRTSLVTGP